MNMFRELDVVKVIKRLKPDRPYIGTAGTCRPPQVGDLGTIVVIHDSGQSDISYTVECIDKDGYTIWLAEFFHEELRLI